VRPIIQFAHPGKGGSAETVKHLGSDQLDQLATRTKVTDPFVRERVLRDLADASLALP
jgi:hypothetical protein